MAIFWKYTSIIIITKKPLAKKFLPTIQFCVQLWLCSQEYYIYHHILSYLAIFPLAYLLRRIYRLIRVCITWIGNKYPTKHEYIVASLIVTGFSQTRGGGSVTAGCWLRTYFFENSHGIFGFYFNPGSSTQIKALPSRISMKLC